MSSFFLDKLFGPPLKLNEEEKKGAGVLQLYYHHCTDTYQGIFAANRRIWQGLSNENVSELKCGLALLGYLILKPLENEDLDFFHSGLLRLRSNFFANEFLSYFRSDHLDLNMAQEILAQAAILAPQVSETYYVMGVEANNRNRALAESQFKRSEDLSNFAETISGRLTDSAVQKYISAALTSLAKFVNFDTPAGQASKTARPR